MPSLSIQTAGTRLSLRSEQVHLTVPGEEGRAKPVIIPLHEIDTVLLSPGASISTDLLVAFAQRGIPVHLHDGPSRHVASLLVHSPPRALTRLRQYQLSSEPALSLTLTRRLIAAKIRNERRILQRLWQRHGSPSADNSSLERLTLASEHALEASGMEALRGYEGAASALFISAWASHLPKDFPFVKRSTRPPGNPVNAVLSYLSALLYGELLTQCHLTGLDPALGLLHTPTDDRYSLPLDLMEPFRPAILFPLTLRLFAQGILNSSHFEAKNPGCWLAPSGRGLLHRQYDKLINREFLSQHLNHRTTLRHQLRAAPVLYKSSLADPPRLLPFLLNGTSALPGPEEAEPKSLNPSPPAL